jgi:hypothetical protein
LGLAAFLGGVHAASEEYVTTNVHLQAEQLVFDPDSGSVIARDGALLKVGDLKLTCRSALLDLDSGTIEISAPENITWHQLELNAAAGTINPGEAQLELTFPRIEINTPSGVAKVSGDHLVCEEGGCRIVAARATACPHTPAGYQIEARAIDVHRSGDLDLERPILRVGDTKIAIIPWIRLRPSDKPGFLPPRLGWSESGGFIFGPAGQLPVRKDLILQGHVAARTSQGLETYSRVITPNADLRIDHLLDAPRNHARARLQFFPDLRGATLAVDTDLVTDRKVIDDLSFEPLDRALTHTSSRALMTMKGNNLILESQVMLHQTFDEADHLNGNVLAPVTLITGSALPMSNRSPIFPRLDLAMARYDTPRSVPFEDTNDGLAIPHFRLSGAPSISIPHRIGPFATEVDASTFHQIWLVDGSSRDDHTRHLMFATAQIDLPFIGRPAGVRHIFTPFARYRITPWISGNSPPWTVDMLDRQQLGHGLESGIDTTLKNDSNLDPHLTLEIAQRFDLPGWVDPFGPAYLFADLSLGPRWLSFKGSGSWDQKANRISATRLEISTTDGRGNTVTTGGSWYGPGRGAHLDRGWSAAVGPPLTQPWTGQLEDSMELFEQASVAFTRVVHAHAGASIGIVPEPRLHALWYGLELRSTCGCIRAGLMASHRIDTPFPDVMATLSLMSL